MIHVPTIILLVRTVHTDQDQRLRGECRAEDPPGANQAELSATAGTGRGTFVPAELAPRSSVPSTAGYADPMTSPGLLPTCSSRAAAVLATDGRLPALLSRVAGATPASPRPDASPPGRHRWRAAFPATGPRAGGRIAGSRPYSWATTRPAASCWCEAGRAGRYCGAGSHRPLSPTSSERRNAPANPISSRAVSRQPATPASRARHPKAVHQPPDIREKQRRPPRRWRGPDPAPTAPGGANPGRPAAPRLIEDIPPGQHGRPVPERAVRLLLRGARGRVCGDRRRRGPTDTVPVLGGQDVNRCQSAP